jgi:predicted DNA-binding protein (MmcQ/YjbR family)
MDIEAIRRYCLGLPHTGEVVQWGGALVLKVDGKMFVVASLEPGPVRLSFKASAENFVELCERPDIIPAPYMARAQWVCLERLNAVPDGELRELLSEAYRLVFERLPKKRQADLQTGAKKGSDPRAKEPPKGTRLTKKVPTHVAGRKTGRNLTGKKALGRAGGTG